MATRSSVTRAMTILKGQQYHMGEVLARGQGCPLSPWPLSVATFLRLCLPWTVSERGSVLARSHRCPLSRLALSVATSPLTTTWTQLVSKGSVLARTNGCPLSPWVLNVATLMNRRPSQSHLLMNVMGEGCSLEG